MRKRYKLEVKETKKYGKGVFAGEDIKIGDVVYILGGKRMDCKDLVDKVNSKKENIDDPLQIGKRTYLDLNAKSRAFNHSCNPNTGLRKTSEMFALRDIKKGEELTFDYSLTIAPTVWKMECRCGAKNCRKVLGDILSIPKRQLEHYRKSGDVQTYMKRLLKEIESSRYKMPKYEILALEKLKI
jgi:hypothetical protein